MKTKEQIIPAYAGVDISKDRLDVSLAGQGPSHYANSVSGIGPLIKVLATLPEPVHVICEPSGGYERALLEGLWEAKIAGEPGKRSPCQGVCTGTGTVGQDRSDRRDGIA